MDESDAAWTGPSEEGPTYRLLVDCNQLAVDIDNEIAVVHNFMRDKYRYTLSGIFGRVRVIGVHLSLPGIAPIWGQDWRFSAKVIAGAPGQSSQSWRAWCIIPWTMRVL